jgi:hypothetical protein
MAAAAISLSGGNPGLLTGFETDNIFRSTECDDSQDQLSRSSSLCCWLAASARYMCGIKPGGTPRGRKS